MDGWSLAGGKVEAAMIDRIMLRFRPIAPRPEDAGPGGSSSGGWKPIGDGKKGMAVASKYKAGRKKRRDATRVRKKNNLTRITRSNKNRSIDININITTRESEYVEGNKQEIEPVARRLSLLEVPGVRKGDGDRPVGIVDQDGSGVVVETWLTVERVMITEERTMSAGSLDDDTCPVFVTDDGVKGVEWVNEAYKRMVLVGVGPAAEVRVGLVVKEGRGVGVERLVALTSTTSSFTCWVRLERGGYTWRKEGRWSRTVPCDVWRMVGCGCGGGGLAWRMDVKAALGLAL